MDAHLVQPHPGIITPFVTLLALIALAPLFFSEWWGKHYPKVAIGLGMVVLFYYLGVLHAGGRVTHTALEYFSFISLVGSLFVVSGGIHIKVKGEATPFNNVVFLLTGAILANFLGTTGASMLLIRPWIRMNKYRITGFHIVFFIFIVSNVGGCLTPIGGPPLFLGYLKGVPFSWVMSHLWPMWLVGTGILLALFYVVDSINYRKAPKPVREKMAEPPDTWALSGKANLLFLAMILGAVFIDKPLFLREALMILAAVGSYFTTRRDVHEANDFNFHPIKEVAILFIGIFTTMMPALDWLQGNAAKLGTLTPTFYYWVTGSLSSVLDNAPTYLSFLSVQIGAAITPEVQTQLQQLVATKGAYLTTSTAANTALLESTWGLLQSHYPTEVAAGSLTPDQVHLAYLLSQSGQSLILMAISVGAVFFGANTYIGNGPNFMVKAIADQAKVETPTFLGYVAKYTLPIMLPMLLVVWWLFFR